MENNTALELLRRLEWSGRVEGQGFGPMHNPGRGRMYAACPLCHGIKPGQGTAEFAATAFDHKDDCELGLMLQEVARSNG